MQLTEVLILKIAIVHDALCVRGGAERVVVWMAKAFPDAPIYTSVYLPEQTFSEFKQCDIRTLPFSRFIKNEKQFKRLFPLWLYLIRRVKFHEFDVVVTSSTFLAKFIKPCATVKHYCYLYAPFRFIWHPESYQENSFPFPRIFRKLAESIANRFRKFDRRTTQAIEKIATSCQNMVNEIEEIYDLEPGIIYPPVNLAEFNPTTEKEEYYLVVSRLIYHKRIDIAVEAFNRLGKQLVIIGDGPEKSKLEKTAHDNVKFTGILDDDQLKSYYRKAKALVFTSHEDFGIVPLEAQASGTPVIAYGNGGVLETVKENESGLFFTEQSSESLISAIEKFEDLTFNSDKMLAWVARFSSDEFITKIRKFVLD